MQSLATDAAAERARYEEAYANPRYRMGHQRFAFAVERLRERTDLRQSLLDVSCGRGELLHAAYGMGFARACGTEGVQALCTPHNAPCPVSPCDPWELRLHNHHAVAEGEFETVICLDVLEHLLEGYDALTLRELARVAHRRVLVTVSNAACRWHVNLRPYDEWEAMIRTEWRGWKVRRLDDVRHPSNAACFEGTRG